MKSAFRTSLLSAALLTFAMTPAAFAQSAGESMHEAGQSAESTVGHVYQGTKTAVEDSALTAKVKTALHDDKITTGTDIHVTTVASVVTLKGAVPSADVSAHAEKVARDTTGVKGVKNKLKHP
jgi:hyperosmotically inducible periplasmic protein